MIRRERRFTSEDSDYYRSLRFFLGGTIRSCPGFRSLEQSSFLAPQRFQRTPRLVVLNCDLCDWISGRLHDRADGWPFRGPFDGEQSKLAAWFANVASF
jgi:hypothetical protein